MYSKCNVYSLLLDRIASNVGMNQSRQKCQDGLLLNLDTVPILQAKLNDWYDNTFPTNQKRAGLKNNSRIPLKVTKSRFPVVWKIIIKKTHQRFLFY